MKYIRNGRRAWHNWARRLHAKFCLTVDSKTGAYDFLTELWNLWRAVNISERWFITISRWKLFLRNLPLGNGEYVFTFHFWDTIWITCSNVRESFKLHLDGNFDRFRTPTEIITIWKIWCSTLPCTCSIIRTSSTCQVICAEGCSLIEREDYP